MSTTLTMDLFRDLTGPAHHLGVGPLNLYVRRNDHDWMVASDRGGQDESRWQRQDRIPAGVAEDQLKWRRFPVQPKTQQLKVGPCFPSRPVVIRPAAPYVILPADKVQFFMSLSVSIRIQTMDATPVTLCEEPVTPMSQTWFGNPESGELCFGSRTHAVRSPQAVSPRFHRIICPVRMKNIASEPLNFERFCLRVQFLSLYRGPSHFWSNEVGTTYKGPDEISRVAYNPSAPTYEEGSMLLAGPRETGYDRFALRSFYNEVMNL